MSRLHEPVNTLQVFLVASEEPGVLDFGAITHDSAGTAIIMRWYRGV
jgi:hypothetical protein